MSDNCRIKKTKNFLQNDTNLVNCFQFNLFSEDIEFTRKVDWDFMSKEKRGITDINITFLKDYLSTVHSWEPSKEVLGDACLLVSSLKRYHPVKQFIESVKWDGVPRIDEWLIRAVGCNDNIYTRMVGAKFLIATVNRIYEPGCKFDHMLILEGEQSIGKSTLCEVMSEEWYLDTNFDNKDLVDAMRGSFWVEISELSGMNKKEVDWLKSFLSRKVDRLRLPYARRTDNFKRKCVFIGTYNPSGNNMYLRDDTGNRRFWPVECIGKVDLKYAHENKMQLWAEAFERYKKKETYYIEDPEALSILDGLHKERELESPTYIRIRDWLNGRCETDIMEVIESCLKIQTIGKQPKDLLSVSTTVGIIMRKLKWRKGTNKDRHNYYSPDWVQKEVKWDE